MIKTAYDLYKGEFEWKRDAYEYVFDKNPFDVVCGTDKIRLAIESGASVRDIGSSWTEGLKEFKEARKSYLLY